MTGRDSIFILTGAGISKESGLDTFRDADGIWAKYKIENVATPEGFARNPQLVHEFYNGRRLQLQDPSIQPNAAHLAIAELQKNWGAPVFLVTQNIDNLHLRAAQLVGVDDGGIQMHGKLLESLCARCGDVQSIAGILKGDEVCSACHQTGSLRPNIVWFGEMPYEMERIDRALSQCAIFISIGTSGTVYPAAGFVAQAKSHRCKWAIECNLESSYAAEYFDECRYGSATEIVPKLVRELLSGKIMESY